MNHANIFDIAQYQLPVTDAAKGGLFLGVGSNNEPLKHNGATGGSLADIHIYPHSGRGFAVMLNCNGGPAQAAQKAQNEMLSEIEEIHEDWDDLMDTRHVA